VVILEVILVLSSLSLQQLRQKQNLCQPLEQQPSEGSDSLTLLQTGTSWSQNNGHNEFR